MYKFCKANGGWWFVCKDLEQLFELHDKTDSRYGLAIIDDCEGLSRYKKLHNLAIIRAESENTSVLESMVNIATEVKSNQIDSILKGNEVWINANGGWNNGLKPEATTYMNKLIFPNCKKEDIKISKFGEYAGGKHYYAKIGSIEVCEYINGEKIIKWNTREEAYQKALAYCEELC